MSPEAEIQPNRAALIADEIGVPRTPEAFMAITQRCGKDHALFLQVLEILAERSTTENLDSQPIRDPLVNQKIGGYKIHWRLGSGGNGDVYLASRLKEPHQQVAIKFLRFHNSENEQFRRRFLRERQIIALLSHPYIVKLFDADRTKDGRPYFVMEYVPGLDLAKYANSKRLTVQQRLDLFLKICSAVQYLHLHLIVHRDLKPENVMVDTDGTPKVLDFGIAKLLRPEFMDGDPITILDRHPLTTHYASPEQWEGRLISSASDVYSLGVILFQLLAGQVPIRSEGMSMGEYRQMVCFGAIPRASKSIRVGHGANCRESSDGALSQRLMGDLDAIVLKALSKDVTERYPTVEALTEDLRRHVQFLPVRARGEARWYHMRRFLRRNRTLAFSVFSVLLALGIGLGIALIQRKEALIEKERAEQQRLLAQRERDRVNELLHQREDVLLHLQRELDNQGLAYQQFRAAVKDVEAQIESWAHSDEQTASAGRGEEALSPAARAALLGRDYELLARLRTLSGDREGARQAFQGCVTNLRKAQELGDVSPATIDTMRRCAADL
jgi:serine/threonine protein kinase